MKSFSLLITLMLTAVVLMGVSCEFSHSDLGSVSVDTDALQDAVRGGVESVKIETGTQEDAPNEEENEMNTTTE